MIGRLEQQCRVFEILSAYCRDRCWLATQLSHEIRKRQALPQLTMSRALGRRQSAPAPSRPAVKKLSIPPQARLYIAHIRRETPYDSLVGTCAARSTLYQSYPKPLDRPLLHSSRDLIMSSTRGAEAVYNAGSHVSILLALPTNTLYTGRHLLLFEPQSLTRLSVATDNAEALADK